MRRLILTAIAAALLAQPVLAQDEADQLLGTTPAVIGTAPADPVDPDPARVAEARRLTAEALAADAAIKARNAEAHAAYRADRSRYEQALAEQRAAEATYQAELAAQQAAVARYEAAKAVWEQACRSGKYSRCEAN